MAISLTAQFDRSPQDAAFYAYCLKITITSASGMPAEVFVFQRGAAPAPAAGEQTLDRYVCIADPLDLEEVPQGTPDLNAEIPYYRLNQVTLAFRSVDELNECQAMLQGDLNTLVRSMNAMANFTPQEVITYVGTAP